MRPTCSLSFAGNGAWHNDCPSRRPAKLRKPESGGRRTAPPPLKCLSGNFGADWLLSRSSRTLGREREMPGWRGCGVCISAASVITCIIEFNRPPKPLKCWHSGMRVGVQAPSCEWPANEALQATRKKHGRLSARAVRRAGLLREKDAWKRAKIVKR